MFEPAQPQAEMMGAVGLLALFTNLLSVALLYSYKDGYANVRSVWLCSRDDAIGSVAVMLAALGVWGSQTAWPDLVAAMIMAGLFYHQPGRLSAKAGESIIRPKPDIIWRLVKD